MTKTWAELTDAERERIEIACADKNYPHGKVKLALIKAGFPIIMPASPKTIWGDVPEV